MKPLKIYVADRFSNKDRVRDLHGRLVAAGHEITHDWTVSDDTPFEGRAKLAYRRENAKLDLGGVHACDYFVMFAQPRATGAQGAWWEAGEAHALGKGIIIVGHEDLIADKDPCVFTWLEDVQRVPDVPALLAYLNAERGQGLTAEAARHHPFAGEPYLEDEERKEDPSW